METFIIISLIIIWLLIGFIIYGHKEETYNYNYTNDFDEINYKLDYIIKVLNYKKSETLDELIKKSNDKELEKIRKSLKFKGKSDDDIESIINNSKNN